MVGFPLSYQYARQLSIQLPEHLLLMCKELQTQFNIHFDVHFQQGLDLSEYGKPTAKLLSTALEQATLVSVPDSTIDVAVHATRRGTEIEVVAVGCEHRFETLRAFSREQKLVEGGFAASLYRARCYDGSIAWIIVQANMPRYPGVAG